MPTHTIVGNGKTRRQRGAVMTAFILGSAAFLALAAVGIDVGRLTVVGTEVQTAAETAATAGARALLEGASSATARSQAQAVVGQNRVAGATAVIQASQLQVGTYNQAGAFVNGGTPATAVRATPAIPVRNLFAGILGTNFANTTVTKTATAASFGVGGGRPTLPLAIGHCHFPSIVSCFQTPGCLPSLTQVPNTTNKSAWTAFFDGSSSSSNVSKYMPTACGGTVTPPAIQVGDNISLNNGQLTSTLKLVDDCVKRNVNTFLVPIVDCNSNFNQSAAVMGFATVVVTRVEAFGSPKGLDLNAIFDEVVGPPTGGNFGTYTIRLMG